MRIVPKLSFDDGVRKREEKASVTRERRIGRRENK